MNSLEQLLRDAMTEQTEAVPHLRPGSARHAVARSRRTQRTRVAAASAATVAATAGVSVLAIGLQPGAQGSAGSAGPSSTVAPPAVGVPANSAAPASKAAVVSAVPPPAVESGDYSEKFKPESEAPAELKAVTLPGPIAGLTITHAPGGARDDSSYSFTDSGKWKKWFWFHPDGTEASSGAVIITRGAAGPLWNKAQSPSPDMSGVTVNGRTGTVWLSGGDREIYYSAGDLTVEVFVSDNNVTLEQMNKIAGAVQGLPQ